MPNPKKKLLPNNFDKLLKTANIDVLKSVFDACDVNARGGYSKQSALAYHDCPDELARWLVAKGADVNAENHSGETPLHSRAGHWQGLIKTMLELGADIHRGEGTTGTPLHSAARFRNVAAARLLIEHGAKVQALNRDGETPLKHALLHCQNVDIAATAAIAELLLKSDADQPRPKTSFLSRVFGDEKKIQSNASADLQSLARKIGENFEFHRAGFNADLLAETDTGLTKLYQLFGVAPVAKRIYHDSTTKIIVKEGPWQEQFEQLYQLLVPSSGSAANVQGEVIRIASRICDELERNGGVNWDRDYKKMADAYLAHLRTGAALTEHFLTRTQKNIGLIKAKSGDCTELCEMAVKWVVQNPNPIALPKPNYHR